MSSLRAAEAQQITPELLSKMRAAHQAADLEYLEVEIPKAIQESLVGVERVTNIMRAMKEFSHPGTAEKAPLNLNRAIESTLTVCRKMSGNTWRMSPPILSRICRSSPAWPVRSIRSSSTW